MIDAQKPIATETKAFLNRWGLKAKYVATWICVDPQSLSKFMHHRLALSERQVARLRHYMDDYNHRNT